MQISGNRELIRRLRNLAQHLRTKIVRAALGRSAADLRRAIAAEAPVRTGALRKSIGKMERITGARGEITQIIGVRAGVFTGKGAHRVTAKMPQAYARKVHDKNPFAARAVAMHAARILQMQITDIERRLIVAARR